MKWQKFNDLSDQLRVYNNQALNYYRENIQEKGEAVDFETVVKPFADEVKNTADQWLPLAKEWVLEEKPPYFYLKQLEDTHENLLISSVLAFQLDTKEKRFREMIQSIDYILSGIKNSLAEQ
ncbi:YppE family protein [Alteribacillus sp. HJP-4]|uniref:YppE family protein n=1 Tax=Alteribacillus sp. HJP-4 TaxID=2775394 RepID=UPI0035CCDB82